MSSPESTRVQHVHIEPQLNTTYNTTPWGYDKAHRLAAIKAITYYPELQNSINGIPPEQLPGRIHGYLFNKSLSNTFAINVNNMIWDNIPELENLPVANDPSSMQQQYVSVPVRATTYLQFAQAIRMTPNNVPGANSTPIQTQKASQNIYQVPTSQLASIQAQAQSGSNFFKWLWGQVKGGN